MITIGYDQPWKYLPTVNVCVQILLTVGLGATMGYFKVFNASTFVPQGVKFVFNVALPSLVLRGLGIGIDFYDDSFLWSFIGAFLILRAIALLLSTAHYIFVSRKLGMGIGEIAVGWLALSWVASVTLGVPVSQAVFGDPAKGQTYGLLAGISSFIFQLPFQLLILECHTLEQEYLEAKRNRTKPDVENPPKSDTLEHADVETEEHASDSHHDAEEPVVADDDDDDEGVPLWTMLGFASRRDVLTRVAYRIVTNPVILAIISAFILSLSTLGPTYLKPSPKNEDFVPALKWVWDTLGWLGDLVSPVSLFIMGLWMHEQGRELFRMTPLTAVLFMISKLVLVPTLMIFLAKAVGLPNEAGRAAVVIAALPISMASFCLAGQYKVGEAVLSGNVALGTLLLLPTMLIWVIVMDELAIFPID